MDLYEAVKENNIQLVKELLEKNNDYDFINFKFKRTKYVNNRGKNDIWTVLMMATAYNYIECVQLLLQAGANPNTQDSTNETALHIASWHGYTECVKLLLQYKANPDLQDNSCRWNSLMSASHCDGYIKCVQLLLTFGANPNLQTINNWTALMMTKNNKIVKILLRYGAKANLDTHWRGYKETALSSAIEQGNTKIVKLLKKMPIVQLLCDY